jgi:ribosomal protein RSM22 (predicted rRNA methylase)
MAPGPRDAPRSRSGRRPSRIHEGLVGQRALIGTRYLGDPELRGEYAAEIAPRTRLALGKVLAEVYGAAGASRQGLRVLDLGAGTGAAGEAVRSFFGDTTAVVSVDRVPGPGMVVADLTAPGVPGGLSGRFDLVIAAHLLNELFTALPVEPRIAARARKVVEWCQSLLGDDGTFIIVEPALRETSRELLAARDRLLAAGLQVVAPCLWSGACPALARERDWCHDATAGGSAGARRVDFSYLVLRRSSQTAATTIDRTAINRATVDRTAIDRAADRTAAGEDDQGLFRVVSDPLLEKGRLRIFGCGPAGRHALVRLRRHRTESNAAFDQLERGDLVRLSETTAASDSLRIGPTTTVKRGRPPVLPAAPADQVPAE